MIDLSHSIGVATPVFPGDGDVRVTCLSNSEIRLSRVEMSLHTGTHLDAPYHFAPNTATADQISLDRCMGAAHLIDLRGVREIRAADLQPHVAALKSARLVLLATGWCGHWGAADYFTAHPCLTGSGAQFLADCGIGLLGVDMPSVDREPYDAHRILLRAGVLIVENLTNLDAIGAEEFQFIALPLKLAGGDGSPVRAIAIL